MKGVRSLMKSLYIEADVDERKASALLEVETSPFFLARDFLCIFTVVSNIFTGLKCTEHTCYDIILINHDLNKGINAIQFASTLRNVGARTPIILVNEDPSTDLLFFEGGSLFYCLLQKPFSARVLCDAIITSMKQNIIKIQTSRPAKKKRVNIRPSRRFTNKVDNYAGTNTNDCKYMSTTTHDFSSSSSSNFSDHCNNNDNNNDKNPPSTSRIESKIYNLDYRNHHNDLPPCNHETINKTNNTSDPVGPVADKRDLNIDILLQQHGDFDLVYLANYSLLDDVVKSDT